MIQPWNIKKVWRKGFFICTAILLITTCKAENTPIAYDMGMAKEICAERALDNLEGIWVYPDDRVTVLILRQPANGKISSLPEYSIKVIEGEDCILMPGDIIGNLSATSNQNIYKIELFTEEKNRMLLKPAACLATLSKDNDNLLIKREKSPFRLRLNLNFNRLLSGFWKIVSVGVSKNNQNMDPPVGMVKIFPSYDGNGSIKRNPRYL